MFSWAESFTASVLVQCIQRISFQEDSKWILCIYFRFNKGNWSNYLYCIVIYKVINSWNNWLNAIAKPFIERVPQSSRDTSYYQTCSTSGFLSKLSPNTRGQSAERNAPLCSEGRLWKLALLESNQRDTTGLSEGWRRKELPPGRLLRIVKLLLNLITVGAWPKCPRRDFRTGGGAQVCQLDCDSGYSSLWGQIHNHLKKMLVLLFCS